jgi:lysophospholipid acyltransferase (LPLAT)-like uncharacterized protein
MLKRILSSSVAQAAIGRLLGLYMRLVGATTRWTYINRAAVEGVWSQGGPVVVCFWHGRTMLCYRGWMIDPAAQPIKVLSSLSREGGIAAQAVRAVGAGVIRGSASRNGKQKGGTEAMREMLRHLSKGGAVALAPDGPRGPRMRAQMGPVQLAKHMKAPIVTFAWATRGRKVFNSWDRFVLPYPFGEGVYAWGEPIRIKADANAEDLEGARRRLEDELNRITSEVDRLAGVPVIEAAAAPAQQEAPAS